MPAESIESTMTRSNEGRWMLIPSCEQETIYRR
ncbi:hypothetical protein CLV67_101221 [Actinoplanes italicus]|uniref:Uncharacterized protein n=1 Tax=Actinoplanes italicus TaxID=113567 RepID=A0A2T0KP30_9ACTN|nr:hypothetical protein CLV67_101221 [Actinoplanes italicus]